MRETIGLLGVGNMGGAILEGLFAKKISRPSGVWIYDKMPEKSRQFARQWKVRRAASAGDLAARARWLVLAVKPQDLWNAAPELRSNLTRRHGVISILAGTPLKKLRRALGPAPSLVRAMPNLGAKAGASLTALTGSSRAALAAACEIFNGCGKSLVLPERFFDLVTAVSGSGPAYFFYLMEILAGFAQSGGLSAEAARLLAVQTALGAALLAAQEDIPPAEWRRRVTSKQGTTEAAFKVLKRGGTQALWNRALRAALNRGRSLSRA